VSRIGRRAPLAWRNVGAGGRCRIQGVDGVGVVIRRPGGVVRSGDGRQGVVAEPRARKIWGVVGEHVGGVNKL
jgi:hypothetical protein